MECLEGEHSEEDIEDMADVYFKVEEFEAAFKYYGILALRSPDNVKAVERYDLLRKKLSE